MLTAVKYRLNYRVAGMLAITIMATLCLATAIWAVWTLELKWALFTILGLLLPFVLKIVPNSRRFVLALLLFVTPLNADANFNLHPSPGGADAFTLGLTDILLFILLVLMIVQSARTKSVGAIGLFPTILVPSLVLLLFFVVSLFKAQDFLWSSFDILNMAKVIIFFFVLANNLKDQEDIFLAIKALFFGLFFQSIIVGLQYYDDSIWMILQQYGLGAPQQIQRFEMDIANVSRPGGTIGHCNHLGRYIGLLLPLVLAILFTTKNRLIHWATLIVAITSGVALIGTLTRSSWIGLLFSVMILVPLLLIKRHFTFRVFYKLGFISVIALLVIVIFSGKIKNRIFEDDNGSARTRITTAKVAIDIIKDHPIIGCGINNYGLMLPAYWDANDRFTRRAAVHNTYLLYAAEIGFLGFAAYLWLLYAFYRRIRKAMQNRNRFYSAIAIGVMSSFAAYLLTALFDKSFKENYTLLIIFWALMALIEAINRIEKKNQSVQFDL